MNFAYQRLLTGVVEYYYRSKPFVAPEGAAQSLENVPEGFHFI